MSLNDPTTEVPPMVSESAVGKKTTGWPILLLAGVFEIMFAVTTNGSHGFTNLGWSLGCVAASAATIVTLSIALKRIDVGIAYAVWTGIGASGAAVFGAIIFHQPLTLLRVVWLAVIIAGIISLKLASGSQDTADD